MRMQTLMIAALCGCMALAAPAAQANWLKDRLKDMQEGAQNAMGKKDVPPAESEEVAQDSVAEDAMTGAAVCGGITAATGGDAKNVAIAGAACGAANAAVTVLGNRGRKKYAAEYQEISKEERATQKKIAQLERSAKRSKQKADDLDQKAKALVQQEQDDQKFIAKAQKLRKELDSQIAKVRGDTTTAQAKIAVLDDQIASLDKLIAESPDIEDYKTTHASLLAQKRSLNEQIKSANGLNDNLVAQKEALDNAIIQRG